MQEKQKEAIDKANQKDITVQKHSFPEPAHDWTARHKKHAIYKVEKDGVTTDIPAMDHLKQVAESLPPMKDSNGRRIYHFENIRRRFMNGKTKEDSMKLVNEYCSEIMEIWNKAVEKMKPQPMKLFAINETEWVAAHTAEEAIEHEALEPEEVKSIVEIPESEWDSEVEVFKVDELEEAEEPETMWVTIRQLMQPAIESGEPAKIMTEEV